MTTYMRLFSASILAFVLAAAAAQLSAQNAKPDTPETAMATFRVKPDRLKAFLELMPAYREALRKSNLVTDERYLLLEGKEERRPIVVEIFSWRTHDIPENVPPEIQVYWKRFNSMVEDRGKHSGIEFPEMALVQPQPR